MRGVVSLLRCGRTARCFRCFSSVVRLQAPLSKLRHGLDRIVGHDNIKDAMVLALVAQEHIYLEGPPGVAKTMLAELAASLSGLRLFCYQMHRDTRLPELVGDSVVIREPAAEGDIGEVIRHAIRPGGILTAEVCVLDDISRAPGEALNVLLRILNERMYGQDRLPLLTAIATSNPALENYYVEPLDPANLDRFTLQVKVTGLLQQRSWDEARRVVELGQLRPVSLAEVVESQRNVLAEAHDALWKVDLRNLVDALLDIVRRLQEQPDVNEKNSLISDRTFLVKAVKIMRAKAVIDGRLHCIPSDLYCLHFLTAFRVPPEVHDRVPKIIEASINAMVEPEGTDGSEGSSSSQTSGTDASNAESDAMEGGAQAVSESHEAGGQKSQDAGEPGNADSNTDENKEAPGSDTKNQSSDGQTSDVPSPGTPTKGSTQSVADAESATDPMPAFRFVPADCQILRKDKKQVPLMDEQPHISQLDALLRSIEGSIERGAAKSSKWGGVGRNLMAMQSLEDFHDADACDLALWIDGSFPHIVCHDRRKPAFGGQLVLCRDVSGSMSGWPAKLASHIASQLTALVKRRRMRMAYVEFASEAKLYLDPYGKPLTRDYEHLSFLGRRIACSGATNYEAALFGAMQTWEDAGGRSIKNRHVVFLTDGLPTVGDPTVASQLKQAIELGVQVHTVYIGSPWNYPFVLQQMAADTDGAQWSAFANPKNGPTSLTDVQMVRRDAGDPKKTMASWVPPEMDVLCVG